MREKIKHFIESVGGGDATVAASESDVHGHYSTNVAFRLAKKWNVSPVEAGQKLKEKIMDSDKGGFFAKIDVVNPGFINFWLSEKAFAAELKEILKKKANYGKSKISNHKSKIQLEYISANPTGPLTLANGRGGFLGDVLASVLAFSGAIIEREYYVNDTGNQIITLGKSLIASLGLIPEEEKFYKGAYVKKWATKHKAFVKKNQGDPLVVGKRAAKDFLAETKKTIEKKAAIRFDRYTSEDAHIHAKQLPQAALALFKKSGATYEKDGAAWLKTTEQGDDKDRVLMTSDGYPTYFLADAGHMLETKKRGFGEKVLILGPDHYGYVARIKAAAKLIGLPKLDIIVTQTIRVAQDGTEIKMSKRKGEFLSFEDVVKEVGSDAMRFMFLMYAPTTHIDFDIKLAKERSLKNPVYYAQYAIVRCRAILQKVKSKKAKAKNSKMLGTDAAQKLVRELIAFPEVVEDTVRDYQVHRLTKYATELARAFHNFYEHERIVGEKDPALAVARLELVRATEIVLGATLDLLGVTKPKKM